MASQELQRLWKLAQIDNRITEIRLKAAALDPGRKIMAEIKLLEEEYAAASGLAHALSAEQKDIELQQRSLDDKYNRIEKELYSGKVTSSREVETLEKEKVAIKKQRNGMDDRLLELIDLVPPAQTKAKAVEAKLADAKTRLAARRKQAIEEKAALEADYAKMNAARPVAHKNVTPSLLTRYDNAKQRGNGIGMVDIAKNQTCKGCGTQLPMRTILLLKEEKLVTCETCHRILYFTEGLV